MSERETTSDVVQRRPIEVLNAMLCKIFTPYVYSPLLWLALVEALLSPFFGYRFALAAIASASVAVGLVLSIAGFGIDRLGQWAASIHEGISRLHSDELERLRNAQRPVAEKPLSPFKN